MGKLQNMYLVIISDPQQGWLAGPDPDQEEVLQLNIDIASKERAL